MTTGGEGGMVTTNDHELWSKMWSFKDHGKVGMPFITVSILPAFGGCMSRLVLTGE